MMENRDGELTEKILDVKKTRGAIILSHNYQLGEIQDIADFIGDFLKMESLSIAC